MLDKKRITVIAGTGGRGAISFIHERSRPLGGPDGGNGGMGGSVNIVARSRLRSLAEFERISRIAAEPGAGGGGGERTGK